MTTTRRSPAGAMTLGASATIVCLLPVFLTGATAVQITADLGFGSVGLGAAVALHRAGAAVTSPFLGRLADDLGAAVSIRFASAAAAISALGIAFTAVNWASLAVWLMLSGAAHGFVSPAANRMLSNAVPAGRLGTAFGIKQSAPPATTMLAGLSVPLLAVTLGWRSGYLAAGVLAIIVAVSARRTVPRTPRTGSRSRTPAEPLAERGVLLLLAAASGGAAAASAIATTFYVASAVPSGVSPQAAGMLFAAASAAAVLTRVGMGVLSDRMLSGHLTLCAGLIAGGAVGLAMLATGTPAAMATGITVAMIGVWGFNGVFWFALVRAYHRTPGRITGAIAPGVLIGATIGPTVAGVIADTAGYPAMWLTAAFVAVASAAGIHLGGRRLTPEEPAATSP